MAERIDQRICIKFCCKLELSSAETIRMINKAFKDDSMSDSNIKVWYKRFKDGRESVNSEPRSGRPSTSRTHENVERVRLAIHENRRLTVRELEEDLNISKSSVSEILNEDLNMRRVAAKFVPKLLSQDQKEFRTEISRDLLQNANENPNFLKTVITGDESWVYGYDPETKAQSSQWKHPESPRPKKVRQSRSNVKVMLTVFFDHEGIVHHEYAPAGQTITKEYYLEVLRRLRDAVRRKRQNLWDCSQWHLHHDNAPAHSSRLVQEFLAKHSITQVPQPPYSPDLAPCDFWLFPKLKSPLKGKRFQTVDEIKQNATRRLMDIPKSEFLACFQSWKQRWEKCVRSQGQYFEGD